MMNKKITNAPCNNARPMQVACPFCGYRMPVFFNESSECRGIYITCKGRGCKQKFEIAVKNGKQFEVV